MQMHPIGSRMSQTYTPGLRDTRSTMHRSPDALVAGFCVAGFSIRQQKTQS